MNRCWNSASEHPSPQPSPLVRRGERAGVRGARLGSWPVSRSNPNKGLFTSVTNRPKDLPRQLLLACRRLGVRLTRHVLVVDVASQTVFLFEGNFRTPVSWNWPELLGIPLTRPAGTLSPSDGERAGVRGRTSTLRSPSAPTSGFRHLSLSKLGRRHSLAARYRCSTSRFGVGQIADSHRTPLGLHRIAAKIGGGWPVGTVFESRKVVGFTWRGHPCAPITSRILWLEGLESGFNRGGKVDTFARYIYLHGTGDEPTLGRPASRGCMHLAAADLLPLYDQLPAGTLVWIQER